MTNSAVSSRHLIIRALKRIELALVLVLALVCLAWIAVYAVTVQQQVSINQLAGTTQKLNEQNALLEVKQQKQQSYTQLLKAVEEQRPDLKAPKTVLRVNERNAQQGLFLKGFVQEAQSQTSSVVVGGY